MRSTPPPGMASRALVARLKRICSAACPSARTSGRSGSLAVTISTSAGRMRRRNPMRSVTRPARSVGCRSRLERRATPSSSCTITRPPSAADMTSRRSACASARSLGRAFAISWEFARMMVSRLLKSWAIPPVSWPIASIFWDWRSCSSRARRSVMSSAIVSKHSIRPLPRRTARPESRTRMRPPSFRFHATSAPRIASPLSNRARMRSRSLESAYTSRAMSRASSSDSVSYPSNLTSAGFAARNLPSGVDL